MTAIQGKFRGESELVAATLALGAETAGGPLSAAEIALGKTATGVSVTKSMVAELKGLIAAGEDPLGDVFSVLRTPDIRRKNGATYTPPYPITPSPTSGHSSMADVADFYFAPGQYIDLSVEANRRKFITGSGKPMNLGPAGANPTGASPLVLFRGNDWTTNKGTGGGFTESGALGAAGTSPSD